MWWILRNSSVSHNSEGVEVILREHLVRLKRHRRQALNHVLALAHPTCLVRDKSAWRKVKPPRGKWKTTECVLRLDLVEVYPQRRPFVLIADGRRELERRRPAQRLDQRSILWTPAKHALKGSSVFAVMATVLGGGRARRAPSCSGRAGSSAGRRWRDLLANPLSRIEQVSQNTKS